jgi:hypothetical protein
MHDGLKKGMKNLSGEMISELTFEPSVSKVQS